MSNHSIRDIAYPVANVEKAWEWVTTKQVSPRNITYGAAYLNHVVYGEPLPTTFAYFVTNRKGEQVTGDDGSSKVATFTRGDLVASEVVTDDDTGGYIARIVDKAAGIERAVMNWLQYGARHMPRNPAGSKADRMIESLRANEVDDQVIAQAVGADVLARHDNRTQVVPGKVVKSSNRPVVKMDGRKGERSEAQKAAAAKLGLNQRIAKAKRDGDTKSARMLAKQLAAITSSGTVTMATAAATVPASTPVVPVQPIRATGGRANDPLTVCLSCGEVGTSLHWHRGATRIMAALGDGKLLSDGHTPNGAADVNVCEDCTGEYGARRIVENVTTRRAGLVVK